MSYTLAYTGAEIDALLGKIDAIFVAEYGSTIYSEVTAAIAAGNKVIVANAGKVFVYAGTDDNSGYVFTQSGPNAAKPNATYVTLSTGNVWSTATVDLATLQQFYASLMEDTASGSIASFPDGAENVPVKELTVEIVPVQSGSGDPSPDNIRPIYSNAEKNKAKMTVAGIKSATGGTWTGNSTTRNGITFTILTDSADNVIGIQANGTASGQALLYCDAFTGLDGDFILNGGITANQYVVVKINDGWSSQSPSSSGVFDRAVSLASTDTLNVVLSVASGQTVNNVTFYPMIRSAANPDPTFVPYRCVARVDVEGKNLLNPATKTSGKYIAADGTIGNEASFSYSALMPVNVGESYTFSGAYSGGNITTRLHTYDAAGNWLANIASNTSGGNVSMTITIPSGVKYVRVSCSNNITNQQFEYGAATTYEAYKDRTYFSLAKNIWDEEWENGGYSNETGAKVEDTDAIRSKNPISVKPNTNYYYKSTVGVRLFYYDADLNYISTEVAINTTKTTPANAYFVNFRTGSRAAPVTTYNHDIAILNAPPEIYGGELNVTTGELKVTDASLILSSANYYTYNSSNQTAAFGEGFEPVGADLTPYKSNIFKAHANSGVINMSNEFTVGGDGRVYIRKAGGFSSGTEATQYVTDNTVQIVAPLATPQIYHLDPVEIRTWLATNNIVCNTGKIKLLVYRCNTALYIEKKLGE